MIAAVKAAAHALVAPQVAEIFARCEQPFFQPIFDLESPATVFGRVALLGDAAFVARPHVGAGVTKAALDAASLADAVRAGDVAAGLERSQREQVSFGRALVRLGREEGAYLSAQLKPREHRSARELKRDARDVLNAHNSRSENLHNVLMQARGAAHAPACGEGVGRPPYPAGVTLTETSSFCPPEATTTPSIGATSA